MIRPGAASGGQSVLTVVYDRVAEAPTGPVISTPSVGVAVRMFGDVVRDERSAMHQHPGDYQLLQIGHLEGVTLVPCEPVVLIEAREFVSVDAAAAES